jgi:ABC-type polysaccharide/polyol phosphate export permease
MFFLLHGLSELVGDGMGAGQLGILPFLACGFAAMDLMWTSLGAFTSKLRRHQTTGMLEACLMTGHSLPALMTAMPTFDLSVSVMRSTAIVVLASLFMTPAPDPAAWLYAAFFGAGGMVLFLAVGLISAALLLRYKAGDPLNRAMHISAVVTGGVFMPRTELPAALAAAGAWVPIAPVVDGVRLALAGDGWVELEPVALRLGILVAVASTVALFAVRAAVRAVLREGSLAHY